MYLHGASRETISSTLGIAIKTVETYIRMSHMSWRDTSGIDMDQAMGEQLAKIAEVERESWQAWKDSKRTVSIPIPQPSLRQRLRSDAVRINLPGDPAFLAIVLKCIDRRCRVLGLDGPHKIDITDRVRQMAIAAGMDPYEAVEEARRVIDELHRDRQVDSEPRGRA